MYDLLIGLSLVICGLTACIGSIVLSCGTCQYNPTFIKMGDFRRREILARMFFASQTRFVHPSS